MDKSRIRVRRTELRNEKRHLSYGALAAKYHVNVYYIFNFINHDSYVPRSREVKQKLRLNRPRPRRIAIHCSDMTSAARTITDNLEPDKVRELVGRLTK